MRERVIGRKAIGRALERGTLRLLLVDPTDAGATPMVEAARTQGVPVWSGSPGDMRRMSPDSAHPESAIGMTGPARPDDLPGVFALGGAVWLLCGVAYPSNVGFVLRTAEVSGASGVIVDGSFNHADRSRIDHVSMGASRLLPLRYHDTAGSLAAARAADFSLVAIEASGEMAPWDVDLSGDVLLIVGGERDGIPKEVLTQCDAIARLPMHGFVPSYSLQAAVSGVALERLRQLGR